MRNMPDATTSSGRLDVADVYRRLEEDGSLKSPSNKNQKKQLEAEKTQNSAPENEKKKTMSSRSESFYIQFDQRIVDV